MSGATSTTLSPSSWLAAYDAVQDLHGVGLAEESLIPVQIQDLGHGIEQQRVSRILEIEDLNVVDPGDEGHATCRIEGDVGGQDRYGQAVVVGPHPKKPDIEGIGDVQGDQHSLAGTGDRQVEGLRDAVGVAVDVVAGHGDPHDRNAVRLEGGEEPRQVGRAQVEQQQGPRGGGQIGPIGGVETDVDRVAIARPAGIEHPTMAEPSALPVRLWAASISTICSPTLTVAT